MPPEVPLLYRIDLTILVFFVFPFEGEYCSFEVCEEFCWDFHEYFIESVDCNTDFGKIAIFTILPVQEHGRSFHFLISFWISFFKDFKFLSYRSSSCLIRVTPRYCMLFVAIAKGVVSLNVFFFNSLFIFCV